MKGPIALEALLSFAFESNNAERPSTSRKLTSLPSVAPTILPFEVATTTTSFNVLQILVLALAAGVAAIQAGPAGEGFLAFLESRRTERGRGADEALPRECGDDERCGSAALDERGDAQSSEERWKAAADAPAQHAPQVGAVQAQDHRCLVEDLC